MTAIFQFAERFTEKPRLGQMCNHTCTLMIARTVFQKQTQNILQDQGMNQLKPPETIWNSHKKPPGTFS